ncbi:MAG: hypothetical protein AABX13_05635 [Nanoarchaeota archaeon]
MGTRQKPGYTIGDFTKGAVDKQEAILTCIVEERELVEYSTKMYVDNIRVKSTREYLKDERPTKGSIPEGKRLFISVPSIPVLELIIGDELMCTGKIEGASSTNYHAELIANKTTGIVYEVHR